ncbi:hypothetical protein [Streptomyces canus]|uniref:hypothetical protein n=1 Tax=Streptomyces canus TaxID=58343 RepID=UPI0003747C6E|nr:hypothetical protein [Streptomyces canus]
MDFTFIASKRDPGRDCFVYTAQSDLDMLSIESLRGRRPRDRFGLSSAAPAQDALAAHMLVMVEGELVACAELVAYSPLGLPLTEWPELQSVLRHSRRLVQCRRPVVRPEFAEAPLAELPFGALGGLFKGSLQWAVSHDVGDVAVELADRRATDRLAEHGFLPVEGSGTPDGPLTYRLNVSRLAARGFRAGHSFYCYLLEYDESVLVSNSATAVA